ncbi:MAG: hypothetical protein IKW83_11210 [Muribaculaceae bacterium]|nr:hypothetical protein [Muribaculaceae bacterium]
MAVSKIDLEEAGRLRSEILSNRDRSFAEISAFISRAEAMLAEFNTKLARLAEEKERAYRALSQCELHKNDDEENPKSCDAEESAYQRAAARYNRCLSLVNQARNAINEFKSCAARNRETIIQLVSQSEHAMNEINTILLQYLSVDTLAITGIGRGTMPAQRGGLEPGHEEHGTNGSNGEYGHNGGNGKYGPNSSHGDGTYGQNAGHGNGSQSTGDYEPNGGHGDGSYDPSGGNYGDSQGVGNGYGGNGNQGASANSSGEGIFNSGNGAGEQNTMSPDASPVNEGASGGTIAAGVGLAALGAGLGIGAGVYFMDKKDERNKDNKKEDDELHFNYVNDDYTSSPDFDMFNPIWQVTKSKKNLPFDNVDDYLKHQQSDAKTLVETMCKTHNLSKEELLESVESERTQNNQAIDDCDASYKEQIDMLEKEYQLADYKVKYKNLKMMEYMEKHPLNPDPYGSSWENLGVGLSNATPWTKDYREEYGDFGGGMYPKEIERLRNELLEKGIPEDEIKTVEFAVNNDNAAAVPVSIVNNAIEGSDTHLDLDNNIMKDSLNRSDNYVKDMGQTRESVESSLGNISDAMSMGKVAIDYKNAMNYESQRDLILESKAKVESRYAESKQTLVKQKEKLDSMSIIINATIDTDNNNSMNRHDQLNLANKIDSAIECLSNGSK